MAQGLVVSRTRAASVDYRVVAVCEPRQLRDLRWEEVEGTENIKSGPGKSK